MSNATSDAASFAADPELANPLIAAVVSTAVQIMAEDPNSAFHKQRAALAYEVLTNPTRVSSTWNWTVSTNPTVVGKWTAGDKDGAIGDLAYVLSTVWNAMAGVTGATS
jgi:hypothetical protein